MKAIYIRFILTFLFANAIVICHSQENNDSLNQIFSSKTFTLIEDYSGDWGGYWHTFIFTVQDKNLRIQWKNSELLKNREDLNVLLPISELGNLKNIFINCSAKIKTSKYGSTEHILYKFKIENLTYIIDDRFTMMCNEDFKAWKEMLLLEGKKQEKK